MKKILLKVTLIILVLCQLCGAFYGCKKNEDGTTTPTEDIFSLTKDNIGDYVIITPTGAEAGVISAANQVKTLIQTAYGVELKVKSDKLEQGSDMYFEQECEILVGNTNRAQGKAFHAELKTNDSGYCMTDKKIIIGGHSGAAVGKSVTLWNMDILQKANDVIMLADTKKITASQYIYDTLMLNGVNIAEYRIVYPRADKFGERALAAQLARYIGEKSGYAIECADDTTEPSAHEIWVGQTETVSAALVSARGSVGFTDKNTYIAADEKGIWISGNNARALNSAMYRFLSLITVDGKTASININGATKYDITELNVSAMTYNILYSDISSRSEALLASIEQQSTDIFGCNEVVPAWTEKLTARFSATYDTVEGKPASGSTNGMRNSVFWKKDKFDLIESGVLWLSDTPESKSKYNYAGGILGNLNEGKVDMRDCLNIGAVRGNYSAGIMSGQSHSGTELSRCVSLTKGTKYVTYYNSNIKQTNCYAVTSNGVNESGTTTVMLEQFMGTAVWEILDTHGWIQRNGDLPVPCEYATDLEIYTTKGTLTDGASVRLAAANSGLRFEGFVSTAWMTAKGYTKVYMLIAPTEYISGDFTVEELGDEWIEENVKRRYILQAIEDYQNTPATDGYSHFTVAIAVKEANYGRAFSAVLVFEDANGNYHYGSYDESKNSRSVKDVAGKATADLNKTQGGEYQNQVIGGAYSPYNAEQRTQLNIFAGAAEVAAMSYNICAEEVTGRYDNVVNEINSLIDEHGIDIIGLQEYNAAWKDKGLLAAITGFTLAGGTDVMHASGSNQWDATWKIGCPILYRADKYTLVTSGFESFGGRASYAIFTDKTGATFMYVNVHTDSDDGKGDLTKMVAWVNDTLRTGDYAGIPVIIGGDTNVGNKNDAAGAVGEGYFAAQFNSMMGTNTSEPTKVSGLNSAGTEVDYNKEPTYSNGYYHGILAASLLDRYFVTNGCKVINSATPYDDVSSYIGDFPSDHIPTFMCAIIK